MVKHGEPGEYLFKPGEYLFVVFIGDEYNKWLLNCKITRFTIFVKGGRSGGRRKIFNVRRKGVIPKLSKCEQGGRGGGSTFWSFCDNI